MQAGGWRATVWKYIEVTKSSSVALLVVTCFGAMVAAGGVGGLSLGGWFLALVSITAGCASADTLTCYIDRDIDALMDRTRGRPLPGKRIHPPEKALVWGLFLGALSLVIAFLLHPLAGLWMFLGLFDNVVIYSLLVKRRSCTNILLGSVSGGMPALFGWAVVQGNVSWTAVLLSLLVITWTPNHIWNLAIRYREDYARANVPMLPVTTSARTAALWGLIHGIGAGAAGVGLAFRPDMGPVYTIPVVIATAVLLWQGTALVIEPTKP